MAQLDNKQAVDDMINDTLMKKLKAKQKKIGKQSILSIKGELHTDFYHFVGDYNLQKFTDESPALWDRPNFDQVFGVLSRIEDLCHANKELEFRAFFEGRLDDAKLLFYRRMTHWYLLRHLQDSHFDGRYMGSNNIFHIGEIIMGLHAIGWHDEAEKYVKSIWNNFDVGLGDINGGVSDPYIVFWFANYFTLGSRDLIEPWVDHERFYDEPNEPQHIYSLLLGNWTASDPADLANILTAYSEHNIALTMLPDNAITAMQVEYGHLRDWNFVPYDVAAIQMRRKSLGLPWVENGDQRFDLCFEFGDEAPLIKDDVIWPVYLQACEVLNIAPYVPRKSLEIQVNRDDYDIKKVL